MVLVGLVPLGPSGRTDKKAGAQTIKENFTGIISSEHHTRLLLDAKGTMRTHAL
jgi:hypothetical protein